jgi:hypothetical protein
LANAILAKSEKFAKFTSEWPFLSLNSDTVYCGLYYKRIVHGHMPLKLYFCVINIKFTAKCPYLRRNVRVHGRLAVKHRSCADFFSVNYGHFLRRKNEREKFRTYVRDHGQMPVNVFIIQATGCNVNKEKKYSSPHLFNFQNIDFKYIKYDKIF